MGRKDLAGGVAGFLEDLFVGREADEATAAWVVISRVTPTAEGES